MHVSMSMFQVAHFKDYIPQAFPGGHSMILDAEVLLIDTNTSKPLPFGTLGVHKVGAKLHLYLFIYLSIYLSHSFCACVVCFSPVIVAIISLFPLPSESSFSGCQRVPFCFRLYLLQWREPHGEVTCFHSICCLKCLYLQMCQE